MLVVITTTVFLSRWGALGLENAEPHVIRHFQRLLLRVHGEGVCVAHSDEIGHK